MKDTPTKNTLADHKNNTRSVQRIAMGALVLALVYGGTCLNIPLAIGNVNLGDGFILLGALLLGSWQAVLAAGIGAALADLTFGYLIYAPATFFIKALMVLIFFAVSRLTKTKKYAALGKILAALAAELVMTAGYYLYESLVIYRGNFYPALAGVPFNLLQGAFALAIFLLGAGAAAKIRKMRPE